MKNKKHNLAYDVLVFFGLLVLLLFILRAWPLLVLAVVAAIFAGIRLLYVCAARDKEEKNVGAVSPESIKQPETLDEDLLRRKAFGLLQRRITEALIKKYPDIRWIWDTRDPMSEMEHDDPLTILLNHAGGYRRAWVSVHNLKFVSLSFDEPQKEDVETLPDEPDETEPAAQVNYSFLAFNWVNDNIMELNRLCNEAIAEDKDEVVIPESMLPARESWDAICEELNNNELEASVEDNQLLLKIK